MLLYLIPTCKLCQTRYREADTCHSFAYSLIKSACDLEVMKILYGIQGTVLVCTIETAFKKQQYATCLTVSLYRQLIFYFP